jgi:sortase B
MVVSDPPESNNSDLLKYIEANAAIYYPDEVDPDGVILALSTCQSAETIERMIVFGTMTEIKK